MKKIKFKIMNKKISLLSVLFLVAIVGIGTTIALAVAKATPVINFFKVGKIDTSIVEDEVSIKDNKFTKKVRVINDINVESDAFIRVRISAPKGITPKISEENKGTWQSGGDGFYYYLYSLAPGDSTTELLSSLEVPSDFNQSFDVTVYHEACVATSIAHYPDGEKLAISDVINAFNNATGTQHENYITQ